MIFFLWLWNHSYFYTVHWLIVFFFYQIFFIWIIVAGKFWLFYKKWFFVCVRNDYYLIFSWLIDSLFAQIWMSFLSIWIIEAGMLWAVLKKVIFFIIMKWWSFYIKSIAWFITCLVLFGISFHLNYCSAYVCCFLTRSDFFVWLWNDYYHIFSLLIDSLCA